MELHVDVVDISVKTSKRFKLHCKAEESGNGEIQTETSLGNLIGNTSGNSLTHTTLLPKFQFSFRDSNPNLVALLFTATSSDNGAVEIGQCLFPITFRGSPPTNITPLDLAAGDIMKQTQLALLTTPVQGTAVNKVVGKIWFKVSSRKPAPKPKLKNQQSILTLKIVQEQLNVPSSVTSVTGPDISELVARETEALCLAPSPIDKPTITVVFHCVCSATSYTDSKLLNPIACIGRNPDIKNDTLFNDSGTLSVIPTLKMVTLKCRNTDEFLELHLANDTLLFSAVHQLRSLVPFKHYNWEYNWKWRLQPGIFNPSHSQNVREPSVMISLVHRPSVSDYLDYEGLEVLVHGIETNSSLENRSIIVCTRITSGNSSSERMLNGRSASSDNVNISVTRFKSASTMMTIPAYYFFPSDVYFNTSRNSSITKLSITLYVTDESNTQLWWDTRDIASTSLKLPLSVQRVLRSPENHLGVYFELTNEDITQSVITSVTTKISGVIRWKEKQLQFMTSEIEARMKDLPAFGDLVFTEPTTAMPSVSSSPTHIAPTAMPFVSSSPTHIAPTAMPFVSSSPTHTAPSPAIIDPVPRQTNDGPTALSDHESIDFNEAYYKTALHKLGMDIMALRLENKQLQQLNHELEKHKRDIARSASNVDQTELQTLSKSDLIFKVLELSRHLSSQIEAHKSYRREVTELHNKLEKKPDHETDYTRLQEVHTMQQKLVHELQTKVEKYRKCYDTCNQQEAVINRLESLLAAQHRTDPVSVLSKENARLRETLKQHQRSRVDGTRDIPKEKDDTIHSLSSELARISDKCKRLEERGANVSPELPTLEVSQLHRQTSRIDELEGKLRVITAREEAMMSELTRSWAQEKAQYEVKLAEYQHKVKRLERRQARDKQHVPHHQSTRQDRHASPQRGRHEFSDRKQSRFISF